MQPGPQLGLKIGGYELVQEFGGGTVSTTWLARDDSGKCVVAKRLLNHLAGQPGLSEQYLRAVELSSKVRMKRFVAIVTSQKSSPDGVFLLREYVAGKPLADFLRRGAVQELNLVQLADDLGEGLRSLSMRGIVHGGLHPWNVIVQPDGRARITDFGTSLGQLGGKVNGNYPLGRLRYLAPEQWKGQPADVKSDIYSLGLIFARLLSAEDLFPANDFRELGLLVQTGTSRSEPVLAGALEPNPARRLGDVEKLRDGLKALDFQSLLEKITKKTLPPTVAHGNLTSLFDLRGNRDLLTLPSIPPIPVPAPLSLANGGAGMLSLAVQSPSRGVIISPPGLDIAPGQRGTMRVDLAADADRFANLFFRWDAQGGPQELVFKIYRP